MFTMKYSFGRDVRTVSRNTSSEIYDELDELIYHSHTSGKAVVALLVEIGEMAQTADLNGNYADPKWLCE